MYLPLTSSKTVCWKLSCSVISDSLWPKDCSLQGSSVHGDSASKNTAGGGHAFLQGIFPTQGSKPGLPSKPGGSRNDTREVSPKSIRWGTSLVVQWLGHYASTAEGTGSLPGWGTKILHATQCGGKKKKKLVKNKTKQTLILIITFFFFGGRHPGILHLAYSV